MAYALASELGRTLLVQTMQTVAQTLAQFSVSPGTKGNLKITKFLNVYLVLRLDIWLGQLTLRSGKMYSLKNFVYAGNGLSPGMPSHYINQCWFALNKTLGNIIWLKVSQLKSSYSNKWIWKWRLKICGTLSRLPCVKHFPINWLKLLIFVVT